MRSTSTQAPVGNIKSMGNFQLDWMDFVRRLSHDLKAPLRNLKTFSEILASDHTKELSEDGQYIVSEIQSLSGQATKMIDGLQNLAKITGMEANLEHFTIATILERIVTGNKHLHLDLELDPELGKETVLADYHLIANLFSLLCDNADVHNPNPSKEITLGFAPELGLYVKDNGPGIEKKWHEEIFKPFRKLHTDHTKTGLGLTLAQMIAEKHNSRIEVESSLDAGSIFSIKLPTSIQ